MAVKTVLMNLMDATPRDEWRRLLKLYTSALEQLREANSTLQRISDEVHATTDHEGEGTDAFVRKSVIRAILAGVPDDAILRTKEDADRYFTE